MAKYLDNEGLQIVWEKVKTRDNQTLTAAQNDATAKVNAAKNELQTKINEVDGKTTTLEGYFTNGVAKKAIADKDGNAIDTTYIKVSEKGANGGVATLDSNGKIPSSQMPGSVDEIIEGYFYNGKFYLDESHTVAITGEESKIYVDLPSNKTYRWSGSQYVEISASLALGETAGTAYEGSKGKKNADDIAALTERVDENQSSLSGKVDSVYNGTNVIGRVTNGAEGTSMTRGETSSTGGAVVVDTTNVYLMYAASSTAIHVFKVDGAGAKFNDNLVLDESMALTEAEINAILV